VQLIKQHKEIVVFEEILIPIPWYKNNK
jgi:hypothetical protein